MNATRPRWGEVWWCEAPDIGRRPVVVLLRDSALDRLTNAVVAPCTTTIRGLSSEVVLEPGDDPVAELSAVNLDSVRITSQASMVERLGRLSDERMRQICTAMEFAFSCD